MIGFILTTYSERNPLLHGLRQEGVVVKQITLTLRAEDLDGCIGYYGNLFDEIKDWPTLLHTRRLLRHARVPYVFWNRDAPWHVGMKWFNRMALQCIKPVDIYLAHSLQDQAWFGGTVHYFPNAAQPAYAQDNDIQALRDESGYLFDVSFFGSIAKGKACNVQRRKAFLDALQADLCQRLPSIRIGIIDASLQKLSVEDQLALIRRSKINLNVGAMCDLKNKDSWGLPERVFGVPAAGGLVLSDGRKHVADTFPENCLPVFDTPQACAALVDQLLSDWNALRDLAEWQHAEITKNHTYRLRARQLIGLLDDYGRRNGLKQL